MLADYQHPNSIESGWLRLLQFCPQQHTINVKTYSPYLNTYKTDPESEFTLDYTAAANAKVIPASVAAEGTVYIRADGSVEPSTAPIQRNGNVYTLTGDIRGSIVVERSGIVIDGAGFTLQGTGADDYRSRYDPPDFQQLFNTTGPWHLVPPDPYTTPDSNNTGIYSCAEKLTIKNLRLTEFWCGIELEYSAGNCIIANEIANNTQGIWIQASSNDTIADNTVSGNKQGVTLAAAHENVYGNSITGNSEYGITLEWSFNNLTGNNIKDNACGANISLSSSSVFSNNNFVNNTNQVTVTSFFSFVNYSTINSWDSGEQGNYWSDYTSRYADAAELNGSGTWNTPYVIDADNQDNHPLVKPAANQDDEPNLTLTLILIAVPTAIVAIAGLAVYRQKRKNAGF